jgi:hypothetical protein
MGNSLLQPAGAPLRHRRSGLVPGLRALVGSLSLACLGRSARRHSHRAKSAVRVPGAVGMNELDEDAEAAAVFHSAMVERSRAVAESVLNVCDFASLSRIIDVGGGHGEMLAAILAAHPELRGVLFDRPHAMEGADRHLAAAGVRERCELVAGDFFDAIPGGGDGYVLKRVIHDWNDARSAIILRNCRAAAAAGTRLVVIEEMLPDHMGDSPGDLQAAIADLNMLVMLGGPRTHGSGLPHTAQGRGLPDRPCHAGRIRTSCHRGDSCLRSANVARISDSPNSSDR